MREHPGDLLHVDVLKLGRIPDGGGWRVHGRKATVGRRHKPVVIDFDYVHVAIGDHSQRAYLEVSDDERVDACASFLRRAVAPLRQHEFVPNPLSGVDVKLRRAAVHLGVIHAAANDFVHIELARDPERHTIEEDPNDPSWTLLRWSNVPAIDPLLGAVLGDYVHNVRSALDQLAYSLVKLNGEEPGRHTFWPIFEAQDQWRTNITNRKATRGPAPTAGASEEAHNLVERWQPFQRGDSSSIAPLLRLHNLWNVDKHRTLHAAVAVPSEVHDLPTITPTGYLEITEAQAPVRPIPIQEGALLLRFRFRELQPLPEGLQITLTPPPIGIAVTFYAEDEFVIAVEHLASMLVDVQNIYAGALELPEVRAATT